MTRSAASGHSRNMGYTSAHLGCSVVPTVILVLFRVRLAPSRYWEISFAQFWVPWKTVGAVFVVRIWTLGLSVLHMPDCNCYHCQLKFLVLKNRPVHWNTGPIHATISGCQLIWSFFVVVSLSISELKLCFKRCTSEMNCTSPSLQPIPYCIPRRGDDLNYNLTFVWMNLFPVDHVQDVKPIWILWIRS